MVRTPSAAAPAHDRRHDGEQTCREEAQTTISATSGHYSLSRPARRYGRRMRIFAFPAASDARSGCVRRAINGRFCGPPLRFLLHVTLDRPEMHGTSRSCGSRAGSRYLEPGGDRTAAGGGLGRKYQGGE